VLKSKARRSSAESERIRAGLWGRCQKKEQRASFVRRQTFRGCLHSFHGIKKKAIVQLSRRRTRKRERGFEDLYYCKVSDLSKVCVEALIWGKNFLKKGAEKPSGKNALLQKMLLS